MVTKAEWERLVAAQTAAQLAYQRQHGIGPALPEPLPAPDAPQVTVVQYDAAHDRPRPVHLDRREPQPAPLPREQSRPFSLDDRERAVQMVMNGEVASYEAAVARVKALPPSTPWRTITDTIRPTAPTPEGRMTLQERDRALAICAAEGCPFEVAAARVRTAG